MTPARDHEARPATIGRYHVTREIGRGATAVVYLAYDPHHDRQVALKVIQMGGDDEKVGRRLRKIFETEGAIAGRLNHPNIVRVFESVVDERIAYMAMEYVEGVPLSQFCDFDRLLPVHRVVPIVFKCLMALDYAFRRGVVHRDIKPANIMLTAGDVPKIADFGLALNVLKQTEKDSTFIMGVGSPSYMSPEQIKGYTLNQQTDLYSMGVVLFYLLTGRLPFRGRNYAQLIYQIVNMDAPSASALNPSVPPELDPVLRKALEKDLYSRYRTASQFAQDLTSARFHLVDEDAEKYNRRFEQLAALPAFAAFERVELWEVLRIGQWKTYDDGKALMREGEEGSTFGVIVSGAVEVSLEGRLLARLEAGQVLGEMSYLATGEKHKRSATVVAMGPVAYLEINPQAFELASDECREHFSALLFRAVSERLEAANRVAIASAPPAREPVTDPLDISMLELEAALVPMSDTLVLERSASGSGGER